MKKPPLNPPEGGRKVKNEERRVKNWFKAQGSVSNWLYPVLSSFSTRKSMRFSSNHNSPSKLEGVPVGGGRVSIKSSFSHTPPA